MRAILFLLFTLLLCGVLAAIVLRVYRRDRGEEAEAVKHRILRDDDTGPREPGEDRR